MECFQKVETTHTSISWWMEKQMWNIYIMEYYSAKERHQVLTPATGWMNPENITPVEEVGRTKPFTVVLFSCQGVSDSLRPHGLQHTRLTCPSPSPGVCPSSCPLNWWWHQTISSSVAPFSCPQSVPASGSFPVSWLFTSGDQSIGASASVLLMNIQGWFPLGSTAWISLKSKGLSRVFSSTTVWKH